MTEKKPIFKSEKEAGEQLLKGVNCFDCGCPIKAGEEEIENGAMLSYQEEYQDFFVFKCDSCIEKGKELEDYKECEVYTRIVGYLRPVNQYNPGKQQEYRERKEYKVEEEVIS